MPTSIGLRWYQTGTVSVTQGSTTLTGVGTNWAGAGIKAGDIFTIDNTTIYEVLTVNSNESITLATAFAGVTGETLNYSIIRNFAATMQAEIAAQVALLVNKYETYIDTELETITGPKGDPGIVYKGTWAAERNYNAMDAVVYNNVLYLAKVPHISSAGNAPGSLGSVWVDTLVTVPAVINDLVTGGTDAALSAQMGVTLQQTKFDKTAAGDMTLLNTTAKSTFVSAINEVLDNVGDISTLDTTAKSSAVAAINEVNTTANTANTAAGTANTNIGTMANLLTTEKGTLVGAVNELHTAISVDVMKALREASGPGIHNALYRGKALGSTFTAAQQNAIDDGSFEDLFVGDHWDFTNVSYTWTDDKNQVHNDVYSGTFRIADCDYYRRSGDNVDLTKHHLIVVPDACMFYRGMNATNTTEGAYAGSEMRTKPSGLARAKAIAEACFGAGTLLSHRQYFENAVTNGRPSAGAWYDSAGDELMTEEQLYGALIFDSGSPDGVTVPYRYTIGCKQFNLFRHRPDLISNRQYFWLQNVVSAAWFAHIHAGGDCHARGAAGAGGVRPAIALRKAA